MSAFEVNQVIEVMPRLWPGINKQGGVGRIMNVTYDNESDEFLYDIDYIVNGGRENSVEERFIKSHTEATGSRRIQGRCSICKSFIKDCGHIQPSALQESQNYRNEMEDDIKLITEMGDESEEEDDDDDDDDDEEDEYIDESITKESETFIDTAETTKQEHEELDIIENTQVALDPPALKATKSRVTKATIPMFTNNNDGEVYQISDKALKRAEKLHSALFANCGDEGDRDENFINNKEDDEVIVNKRYDKHFKSLCAITSIDVLIAVANIAVETIKTLKERYEFLGMQREELTKRCRSLSPFANISISLNSKFRQKLACDILSVNDEQEWLFCGIERGGFEILRCIINKFKKYVKQPTSNASIKSFIEQTLREYMKTWELGFNKITGAKEMKSIVQHFKDFYDESVKSAAERSGETDSDNDNRDNDNEETDYSDYVETAPQTFIEYVNPPKKTSRLNDASKSAGYRKQLPSKATIDSDDDEEMDFSNVSYSRKRKVTSTSYRNMHHDAQRDAWKNANFHRNMIMKKELKAATHNQSSSSSSSSAAIDLTASRAAKPVNLPDEVDEIKYQSIKKKQKVNSDNSVYECIEGYGENVNVNEYHTREYANLKPLLRRGNHSTTKEYTRLSKNSKTSKNISKNQSISNNANTSTGMKHVPYKISIDNCSANSEDILIYPPKTQQELDMKPFFAPRKKDEVRRKRRRRKLTRFYHTNVHEDHSVRYDGRVIMIDHSRMFHQTENLHFPFRAIMNTTTYRNQIESDDEEDDITEIRLVDQALATTSRAIQHKRLFQPRAQQQTRIDWCDFPAEHDPLSSSLSLGSFTSWQAIGKYWFNCHQFFRQSVEVSLAVDKVDPNKTTFLRAIIQKCKHRNPTAEDKIGDIVMGYYNLLWMKANASSPLTPLQEFDNFKHTLVQELNRDVKYFRGEVTALAEQERLFLEVIKSKSIEARKAFYTRWEKEYSNILKDSCHSRLQWIHQVLFGRSFPFYYQFKKGKASTIATRKAMLMILSICNEIEKGFVDLPVSTQQTTGNSTASFGLTNYLVHTFGDNSNPRPSTYEFVLFSFVLFYYYLKIVWLTNSLKSLLSCPLSEEAIKNHNVCIGELYSHLDSIQYQLLWALTTTSNRFLFGILSHLIIQLQTPPDHTYNANLNWSDLLLSGLKKVEEDGELFATSSSVYYGLKYEYYWKVLLCATCSLEDMKIQVVEYYKTSNVTLPAILQISFWERINTILAVATTRSTLGRHGHSINVLPLFPNKPKEKTTLLHGMTYHIVSSIIRHPSCITDGRQVPEDESVVQIHDFRVESLWALLVIASHLLLCVGSVVTAKGSDSQEITANTNSHLITPLFRVVNNWHVLNVLLTQQLTLIFPSIPNTTAIQSKPWQDVLEIETHLQLFFKSYSRTTQFIGLWDNLILDGSNGIYHQLMQYFVIFCQNQPVLLPPLLADSLSSYDSTNSVAISYKSIWLWLQAFEKYVKEEENANKATIVLTEEDSSPSASSLNAEKSVSWICKMDHHSSLLTSHQMYTLSIQRYADFSKLKYAQNPRWHDARKDFHFSLLYVISMLFHTFDIINPWETLLSTKCHSEADEKTESSQHLTRISVLDILRSTYQQLLFHLFSSHQDNSTTEATNQDSIICMMNYECLKTHLPEQQPLILSLFTGNPCLENGLLVGLLFKELMQWYGQEDFSIATWQSVYDVIAHWGFKASTYAANPNTVNTVMEKRLEQMKSCLIMCFAVLVYTPLPIPTSLATDNSSSLNFNINLESVPQVMTKQEYFAYQTQLETNHIRDMKSLAPVNEVFSFIHLMMVSLHETILDDRFILIHTSIAILISLVSSYPSCSSYYPYDRSDDAEAQNMPKSKRYTISENGHEVASLPFMMTIFPTQVFDSCFPLLKDLYQLLHMKASFAEYRTLSINQMEMVGSVVYLITMWFEVFQFTIVEELIPLVPHIELDRSSQQISTFINNQISYIETFWDHVIEDHFVKWKLLIVQQSKKYKDTLPSFHWNYKKLKDFTQTTKTQTIQETFGQLPSLLSSVFSSVFSPNKKNKEKDKSTDITLTKDELFKSITVQIIHHHALLVFQSLVMEELVNAKITSDPFKPSRNRQSYIKVIQDFYSLCTQVTIACSSSSNISTNNNNNYLSYYYQLIFWQYLFHLFTNLPSEQEANRLMMLLLQLKVSPSPSIATIVQEEVLLCNISVQLIAAAKHDLLEDIEFDFFQNQLQHYLTLIATKTTVAVAGNQQRNPYNLKDYNQKLRMNMVDVWHTITIAANTNATGPKSSLQSIKMVEQYTFQLMQTLFVIFAKDFPVGHTPDITIVNGWKGTMQGWFDQTLFTLYRGLRYMQMCFFKTSIADSYRYMILQTKHYLMTICDNFFLYLFTLVKPKSVFPTFPMLQNHVNSYFQEFITPFIDELTSSLYHHTTSDNNNEMDEVDEDWEHYLTSVPLWLPLFAGYLPFGRLNEWKFLLHPLIVTFLPSSSSSQRRMEVIVQWIVSMNNLTITNNNNDPIVQACCERQRKAQEHYHQLVHLPISTPDIHGFMQQFDAFLCYADPGFPNNHPTTAMRSAGNWKEEIEKTQIALAMKNTNKSQENNNNSNNSNNILQEIQNTFQKYRKLL